MNLSLPVRIAAVAVVLALALVGLVLREGIARENGREVILAINGYDPRSPLSGDYAAFQLRDISPGGGCPPGVADYTTATRPKWVALSRRGDHHVVTGAGPTRAAALARGEMVVRGVAFCFDRIDPTPAVSLEIGVNRFHASQKQAQAISAQIGRVGPNRIPLTFAVVSLGADGKARLKGLIVAGKRTDLTWW